MQPRTREVLHYLTASGEDPFQKWVDGLKDVSGRANILKRLARVEEGNFGDHRYVGGGIWELRIHYGPGYRLYYGEDGLTIVLLLCGGDKSTQNKDIRKAQGFWTDYGRQK